MWDPEKSHLSLTPNDTCDSDYLVTSPVVRFVYHNLFIPICITAQRFRQPSSLVRRLGYTPFLDIIDSSPRPNPRLWHLHLAFNIYAPPQHRELPSTSANYKHVLAFTFQPTPRSSSTGWPRPLMAPVLPIPTNQYCCLRCPSSFLNHLLLFFASSSVWPSKVHTFWSLQQTLINPSG